MISGVDEASGGGISETAVEGRGVGTDARYSAKVWGLDCNVGTRRWRSVMAYATPAERLHNYALVCVAFVPGAAAASVKSFAFFEPATLFGVGLCQAVDRAGVSHALVSALDRVEAANLRFPALLEIRINLEHSLAWHCWTPAGDVTQFEYSRAIFTKLSAWELVTSLNLCENGLAVLPDEIGGLANLKTLCLDGNAILELPDSIGRLTALKRLSLDDNQLAQIPASICSLTGLVELWLRCNRIATLPYGIGQMTALTALSLSSNNLTDLSDAIGQLTRLESLRLGVNRLTSLPDSIGALTSLVFLDLCYNPHCVFTAQSHLVQTWLRALEDSPACDFRFAEA